jgi:hypothetical protein
MLMTFISGSIEGFMGLWEEQSVSLKGLELGYDPSLRAV